MALEEHTIDITLAGGLDTKTDEKNVQPGKLLKLENAVMQKTGSVSKRYGYENLPVETAIPILSGATATENNILSGNSIHSHDNAIVLVGNDSTATGVRNKNGPGIYEKGDNLNKWVRTGHYIPVTYTTNIVTNADTDYFGGSIASDGDIDIVVYHGKADLIDRDTGTKYQEMYSLGTSHTRSSRAVYVNDAYGSSLFGIAAHASAGTIAGQLFDAANPTAAATAYTIATDYNSDDVWDLTTITYPAHFDDDAGSLDGYTEALIVYSRTDGNFGLKTFDSQGNIHRSEILASGHRHAVGVYCRPDSNGNTDKIYIAYEDDTQQGGGGHLILCDVLDPDLTVRFQGQVANSSREDDSSPLRNITLTAEPSFDATGTAVALIYDYKNEDQPEAQFAFVKCMLNEDGGEEGTQRTTNTSGYALASKAFTYNGNAFVLIQSYAGTQPTYFLCTTMDGQYNNWLYCAKLFYARGPGFDDVPWISDVVKTGDSQFTMAVARTTRLTSGASNSAREKHINTVTFEMDPDPLQSVQVGPSMLIGGGIITGYDGAAQAHGWHMYPEQVATKTYSPTGGRMDDGYRSFRAQYTRVDRNGEIHRSAPSDAYGHTFDAQTTTQKCAITVQNILHGLSNERLGIGSSVEIFRTPAGSSIYFLDTGGFASTGVNETDVELQLNEILYTSGGEVANIGPPASNILAARKDRVFLVPMDDRVAVWYSKPKIFGVAVNFSDTFVLRIEADGDNTGLAVLDDKVIVFKERAIYFFGGDGPNAQGQGGFSTVQKIQSDVGCIDSNSIVNIGSGVLFKSHKGIYMVDRSLAVQYVGAPVEDYNTYTITSATLVEDKNQARFTLSGGQPMLVYDYFHNQWSTYTNHPAKDAVVHDGKFHWLRGEGTDNGRVKRETDTFLDAGGFSISAKVRTPWIKLSSIQGFQRIKRAAIMGDFKSHHTLNVKVYVDYNDNTAVQTKAWSTVSNHTAGEPLEYQFHLKRQKCQSIMFEIWDSSTQDTHESLSLNTISLTCGVKKGLNKLPGRKSEEGE